MRGPIAWLLLAPLACSGAAGALTLGLVAPPAEPDATSLLRGVQMAVEESAGHGVSLEVRGSRGQWATAGNDAVDLVAGAHVDGIVAPSDGVSCHLVLQVSGRTRVPVATLCPDASATETGVPWALRVAARTDEEAKALFNALGPGSAPVAWSVVVPAGDAGRAFARDLAKGARLGGARIGPFFELGAPDKGLESLARTLAASSPGAVLLWLPASQAGAVAAALRRAGYGGRLAGPGTSDSPDFIQSAGGGAEGFMVAQFQSDAPSRARSADFGLRYLKRFGTRPDLSAALAHDAALVLIETLNSPGDAAGYRRFPPALATAGVTGEIRFDSSGNRTGALQVLVCRSGRFTPFFSSPP